MGTVAPGSDNLMVPVSDDSDCDHLITNVPAKEPLYLPFHVPDSADAVTAEDDGGTAAAGDVFAAVLTARDVVVRAAADVDSRTSSCSTNRRPTAPRMHRRAGPL